MALGAAVSTSKTEVEVIVFVAIMLHKVDNDFYFLFSLLIFYMHIKKKKLWVTECQQFTIKQYLVLVIVMV